MSVIDIDDASFGYGDTTVLSHVTLHVSPGETLAVLGPNGSGKSTLMRGIIGLGPHRSGCVRLFGEPAEQLHDRARIGYVPQRHTLSASVRATVSEIVSTGRLPRLGLLGRLRAHDHEVVRRSLELVGLSDRADTEVSTLSGGQQRRVLIARALAGEPEVLVMDEPTAGVDAASQHVLAEVLGRLAARGVTMLIVTHELAALEPVITRVVVVDRGAIAFDGPVETFVAGRDALVHDHDYHHHDLELSEPTNPELLGSGPLDPTTGPRR